MKQPTLFWLTSAIALCGLIISIPARSQVVPDATLPNNSSVTTDGNTSTIIGGTQAGGNLFHSFEQFSIPTGGTTYFNNTPDIQNIFSRVTGKSISKIDGLIRANGTANLFLINPNGIIFGPNARLNVGGSFVATTANAISFGNQGFFSATNPSNPSLLTVNPTALLFNQIRAASIENNSAADSSLNSSSEFTATGLRVPEGNSLLLVGGDINIDARGLYAFGGRVELGGVAGAGTIRLNGDGNNLSLSFPTGVQLSDVSLTNGSEVDVTGEGGGNILINARNLNISDSFIEAGADANLGFSNQAENITLNASNITIPGNITLNASNITITGKSIVVLKAPNLDHLSRGLAFLPTVPLDTEVAQACSPGGSQANSEFVVTGRGGLPPSPSDLLSSDAISVDLVTLNPDLKNQSSRCFYKSN